MTAVIQEAYIQGVSTRSVDDLVKAMGMTGVSKSQVSRLCVEIDERVDAFLDRPLEGEWPYLWLDATYIKVRRSGRIVSVAAIVAVAVNLDGRREVLGIAIQPSEAEVFWDEFLRSLADRGLRGVKLITADEHKGLKAAAAKVLGATIQRCRVHFMRNALCSLQQPSPTNGAPRDAIEEKYPHLQRAASISPLSPNPHAKRGHGPAKQKRARLSCDTRIFPDFKSFFSFCGD